MNTHKNLYVARNGTYYSQGSIKSQYNGFNILNEDLSLQKVIAGIENNQEWKSITHYADSIVYAKNDTQTKTVCVKEDELQTRLEGKHFEVHLDPRGIHDFPTFGREFNITKAGYGYLITYTLNKKTTYIAIKTTCKHTLDKTWIKRHYEYDAKRKTKSEFYTYKFLTTTSNGLLHVKVGSKKTLRSYLKTKPANIPKTKKLSTVQTLKANTEALYVQKKAQHGYLAGHPWFFQVWSRDELTSLGGILTYKDTQHAFTILQKYWKTLQKQGSIPNRVPHSTLASSDATGWFFKRLSDYNKKQHNHQKEINEIGNQAQPIMIQYYKDHEKKGLIQNNPLETWMDTGKGYDERDSFRIEIQALMLKTFQTIKEIKAQNGQNTMYITTFENNLKKAVKTHFFKNILHDGLNNEGFLDTTTRPNVFLAYYIYKDLLTKKQWEQTFDHALQKLWQPWGGLSTIDKENPLYHARHTGITNESYHRGDSWYYINNIAAIALHDVHKDKYKTYIQKIKQASLKDLQKQGYIGCCSEITNSEEQNPFGCFNQLWSNATLLELLHKTKE